MSRSEPKGTFRCYEAWNPKQESIDIVNGVNAIVAEYDRRGLKLSLRQIYYQFVARKWIANKQSEYDRLGGIISKGRMAGLISWTAIEDRGRSLKGVQTYEAPQQVLKAAMNSYRIDLWANQQWRPEVWVEKVALEGVISEICYDLRVDFFAQKGYNSMSNQWDAGQRFANYIAKGQRPIVFHFGDHDPSGLDMTNDNRSRLEMFAGVPIIVQRLALSRAQIDKYNLPPDPAKKTDSRYDAYSIEHGDESWELDALDPTVIQDLISENVNRIRDPKLWDEMVAQETEDLRVLEAMMEGMG